MSARLWLASVLALGIVLGAGDAHAQDPVTADIFEISASTGKTPMFDAELKPLEKKLKKPAFAAWNQFKLLMKTQQTLVKRKPASFKLKIGSASVTLVEIVDKSKCRLTIAMQDDKGKEIANSTVKVEAGDYVVLTVSLPNNDGHLLALSCK
jgi:hypothetical protein